MRIIGLDWGTVRVGVAMSDEEGKLAFPLQHTLDGKTAPEDIRKLAEEYDVGKIVLGLPLNLQGQESDSSRKTRKFADKVKRLTGMEPQFVDERFSSVQSGQALRQQEIKEKDQRQIKDNIAAALMLQNYLDSNPET